MRCCSVQQGQLWLLARLGLGRNMAGGGTYIDAPELFDRVEGDDLLQKVIPVVALLLIQAVSEWQSGWQATSLD